MFYLPSKFAIYHDALFNRLTYFIMECSFVSLTQPVFLSLRGPQGEKFGICHLGSSGLLCVQFDLSVSQIQDSSYIHEADLWSSSTAILLK